MRIAYFTDSYFPKIDGVARSVDSFAGELARLRQGVVVFCPRMKVGNWGVRVNNGRSDDGIASVLKRTSASKKVGQLQKVGQFPVVRFNSFSYYFQPEVKISLPAPLSSLRQALQPFDIVHSHSPGPLGILAEEVALLRGTPHIHTFHTMLSDYGHYLFQGRLLTPEAIARLAAFWCNRVDFIVAPSKKVKEHLRREGVKQPIQIIPTGVDLSRFRSNVLSGRRFLLKRGLMKRGELVFLCVGRIGREKSIDRVLRAFADLLRKVGLDGRRRLRLLVVGDGPELTNLTQLARRLGIAAYVTFAGYIEPELMPKAYGGSDVFVFASTTETQGLVVLEAMASGLPVVAIDDGAVAEVVRDGENGFLTESPAQMAEKMRILFSQEEFRTRSARISLRLAQNFSIQKTTRAMLKYYQECRASYSARSRRRRLREQYVKIKRRFARVIGELKWGKGS